jgi:Zn finger protein HypA/HybF involved in hydrogenase expression
MENELDEIDAECNDCDWKGFFVEMDQPEDDDEGVLSCPCCGSENIYYFNMP